MPSGIYQHKKLSEEHKRKLSLAHLDKKYKSMSEQGKKNISLAKLRNPTRYWKDKKFSDETKKKLSLAHKGRKLSEEHKRKLSLAGMGKKLSEETKRKISKTHKGKYLSEEHKRKLSLANIGKIGSKSSNWKGGITSKVKLIRHSGKYLKWRSDVLIRDNFTCQKCGQIGGKLEVHHIKSFSKLIQEVKKYLPLLSLYEGAMIYLPLWEIPNGKTLCVKCHNKTKK